MTKSNYVCSPRSDHQCIYCVINFVYILAYACLADGTDCIIIHHLCNILCTLFDLKLYDCMNRNSIILQVFPFPYKINDYDMNNLFGLGGGAKQGQTVCMGYVRLSSKLSNKINNIHIMNTLQSSLSTDAVVSSVLVSFCSH